MIKPGILSFYCLSMACNPVFAEQPLRAPKIVHDPFAMPLLQPVQQVDEKAHHSDAEPSAPWNPQLSSTLRAGKNSMVVIGNRVIRLGEKVDGYKLIKVEERSAVFVKNRQRTRLTLDE